MSPFRPAVDAIEGYVPGEQPQETGWVKLNTNENPYPPSQQAIEAIVGKANDRLNVYPDPLARGFCQLVAEQMDLDPEWILPANGSDENLTILLRSFVEPGEQIACPYPSYILYETLAAIQGAGTQRLLLNADWSFDFAAAERTIANSKLVLVPNPNSPSGTKWSHDDLLRLVPPKGVFVLDEAYGAFADNPHDGSVLQSEAGRRIVMTRTVSKAFSLAGLRFGYAIAHPDLIRGMRKVKDSYNCDALAIAGATAALADTEWLTETTAKIRATRRRLSAALAELGFEVTPSQANFVWVTHPDRNHQSIYQSLKENRVLIRYMQYPEAPAFGAHGLDGLRITIGTDAEIDRFLDVLRIVLGRDSTSNV
ncbi:histidinol-phosphate transaminase [Stratiformator vulcanicus]|uniref:Histidinol-phosphate aminotransferase n=1 Tax=Stratiformator vulcanicus TaxID=2527980 RepID=A0A517R408_9PLAN|nr:histidinol-phosphate transaminase [Stratiformator vulcanicus]QDT38573.1 Histidinol-phosphate aminotransferase [Stratiformator vulcanicus]